MKKISLSAKWFLSFTFAVLLATATFTGCNNTNEYSAGPGDVKQVPTAAHHATPSQADFGQSMAVQNAHTDDLLEIEGVNGTGVGFNEDGEQAIYIFTDKEHVEGLPATLGGFPTHIEYVGEVSARAVYTGVSGPNPVQSGFSIGNDKECAAGTIGCVVADGSGKKYFLSNNHVFARVNAATIGERIDQPGRYDAIPQCAQTGQVASLSNFAPINFNRKSTNTVDCAIAEFAAGASGTTSNLIYHPTSIPVTAFVGQAVKKVGRTTGFTNGTVQAINVTSTINYGNGRFAKFVNQINIIPGTFSAAGDSGSLIVDDNNNPVGLLFAGSSSSTIANPIGLVLAKFGGLTIVP